MLNLKAKIVPGCQIASRTVLQQSLFFEKKGIPKEYLINGSINVDVSPRKWKIKNPDFEFKNIVWRPGFTEDFNFIWIEFIFDGKKYPGLLYNPGKTENPPTMLEVLAKKIIGIEYGKQIELFFPDDKIEFYE